MTPTSRLLEWRGQIKIHHLAFSALLTHDAHQAKVGDDGNSTIAESEGLLGFLI